MSGSIGMKFKDIQERWERQNRRDFKIFARGYNKALALGVA